MRASGARNRKSGHTEARDQRRGARQQRLLNRARFLRLAAHTFALFTLIAEEASVVYRDGDVSAQPLQQT